MGTFSVYGIMGQKHGRVEVQIGIYRGEHDVGNTENEVFRTQKSTVK